ncbi:heterochromatin protein 1-like [Chironomus tepperi]|uniref:heterochromatin protein 1-like n=1 Tax=Chironomus tepperi TaxID=113505 RepID=UPI00391F593D
MGYDDEENTWEPRRNINSILVDYYYKEKKNKDPEGKDNNKESSEQAQNVAGPSRSQDPVDIVDAYQEDPIYSYLEHTTNSAPLEVFDFGDQPSTSRVTKLKRRLIFIKGYSNKEFEDNKLRMVVKFEGETKFSLVPYDEVRCEYPQKLIDFFEERFKFYEESLDFYDSDDYDFFDGNW